MKRYKVLLDKLKNKAFTLIELLAVIVILAIIALIATPIILNIIEKARKSAFQDTAYGLIETARLEYTEGILDGDYKEKTYTAPFDDLKFSGSKPNGGTISVGSDGKIAIAIHNNKWCAVKEYEETVVRMIHYEEETCKITGEVPKPVEKGTSFEEEMKKQSDQVMSNDPGNNPRYVGSDPNNYVSFNNELWRVIGVFDGQAKIIRNEAYGENREWNTANVNDWSKASSQVELNTTYLNSIDETSRSYIDETHVWKLGGVSNTVSDWTRSKMYLAERGTTVYNGRPVEWIGSIGLMYPSDYGYSTSSNSSNCDSVEMYVWNGQTDCINNNWLRNTVNIQWTLSVTSETIGNVFLVDITGYIGNTNSFSLFSIRPTLYLKSNIKIKSGTGSNSDPFILTN